MRQAIAETAHKHWHALRCIAPDIDPRTLSAESVATTAAALLSTPALWQVVHLAEALCNQPGQARRLIAGAQLDREQLAQLADQLSALDRTARTWTAHAYHRGQEAKP